MRYARQPQPCRALAACLAPAGTCMVPVAGNRAVAGAAAGPAAGITGCPARRAAAVSLLQGVPGGGP